MSETDATDPQAATTSWLSQLIDGPGRERFVFFVVMAASAGVIVPFLGAGGFFDPWETHYAEVARSMVVRDDYLYPFWKDSYFFSKPVLLFWLTAPFYGLLGAGGGDGELSSWIEFFGRLPVAAFSLLLVAVAFHVQRVLVGLRAAALGALVLASTPVFAFMSRQAITDTLYVAPMSTALLLCALLFLADEEKRRALYEARIPRWLAICLAVCVLPQMWEIGRTAKFFGKIQALNDSLGEFGSRIVMSLLLTGAAAAAILWFYQRAKDPLFHAAALLLALATLGKGPHAVVFVVMVLVLYMAATSEWEHLVRPSIPVAAGVYLLVAAPWVIVMLLFDGRDDTKKTWYRRFVLHDLLGRMGGVHGERGTFEYYVRYLSFGLFQWVPAGLMALFAGLSRGVAKKAERTQKERFVLLTVIWAVSLFAFFSFIGTKFHHYIYPVVIPAALLIGWWLDDLLKKRQRLSAGLLLFGVLVVAALSRDLGTEPWQWPDLFTYHYVSYKPSYYFPREVALRIGDLSLTAWQIGFIGFGILAVLFPTLGYLIDVASEKRDAALNESATSGEASSTGVPDGINSEALLPATDSLARLGDICRRILGAPEAKNAGFVSMSLVGGVLITICAVHIFMAQASVHWTQRHIFHTYHRLKEPGEPIIAYQMDWKGETFYGKNQERQIKKSASDLKKAVEKPGREFIVVQQDRFSRLKSAIGKDNEAKVRIVDQSGTKWYLVLVE